MGTAYIDRKDIHIKLDGQSLAIYSNNAREGVIPINPLKRVVIIGNIMLDTNVLHRLSDNNISVLFLSGKTMRFRGMLHGKLHNNGVLRLKQYEKTLTNFSKETALHIVSTKIKNQILFFNELSEKLEEKRFYFSQAIKTLEEILEKLNVSIDLESLRGFEGGASATYFSVFTKIFPESLEFKKRNRRPPEDPVNAMLSLCYTLLHYEAVREIEVIGLDPTIGFYHQFEYGRESLACDIVEIYRTDVDKLVWKFFREQIFTAKDFSKENEKPGCYLKKESRKTFYPLYEDWAKEIRTRLREEVRKLAEKIMNNEQLTMNNE